MVSNQTKSIPKTAVKALLYLDEHKAEIVLHENKSYLLSGDKALYLTDKIFDALLAADWITSPQAIDSEHSNCLITPAGRKKANAIRSAMSAYIQLPIFDVEPEEKSSFVERVGSATAAGRSR